MNHHLFFSSVCDVKTAILEQKRDSGLQRDLLFLRAKELIAQRKERKCNNKKLRAAFTVQRHLLFLPHQPQKTTYHATMK